ncbi:MAG TPA: signal peptidase II, partial [Streptomyces sp.]
MSTEPSHSEPETESDTAAAEARPETVQETPAAPAKPLPKRRVGWVFAVAAVFWAIDLVTKNLVAANLEGKEPQKILGGLIYLQVIRNPGAAFSMATG